MFHVCVHYHNLCRFWFSSSTMCHVSFLGFCSYVAVVSSVFQIKFLHGFFFIISRVSSLDMLWHLVCLCSFMFFYCFISRFKLLVFIMLWREESASHPIPLPEGVPKVTSRDLVALLILALRVFPAVTWLTVYRWLKMLRTPPHSARGSAPSQQ